MSQFTIEGCVDIHTHILHNVDDGAASLEDARKMLEMAALENVGTICTTPHFNGARKNPSRETLEQRLEELKIVARDVAPDLQLVLGNEMFYSESALNALLDGTCLTLAASRYVLVEFHPQEYYKQMRQSLFRIISEGFRPILAHAERYEGLRGALSDWEALIRMGVLIQINADSIEKAHHFRGSARIRELLKKEMVHFIATDCHDTGRRSPKLKGSVELIAKKYGKSYANRLFRENPEKVLRDEEIR